MAFDGTIPMTKPALMTAAAALLMYDRAVAACDVIGKAAAADALATVLRAKSAPKAKASGPLADLRAAFKVLLKATGKKPSHAYLAQVLMVANGDTLALSTTDHDQETTITVAMPGVGEWAACVEAKRFADLIAKGSGELSLDYDGAQLLIHLDDMLTTMTTLDAEDFPAIDPEGLGEAATVPAAAFADALAFARVAVSTEETRYYLNGVYMHTPVHGPTKPIVLVATDGHRLQRVEIERPAGFPIMQDGVIIRRAAVDSILAALDKADGDVSIQMSRTHIRFQIGETVLTSSLIDGAFPDYPRVIPTRFDGEVLMTAEALDKSVERLMKVSAVKTKSIRLEVRPTVVVCTARDMGGDEATSEVPASRDGDPITVAFQGNYLRDVCAAYKGQNLVMQYTSESSPSVFRDPTTPDRLSVVMPIRW